MTPSLGICISLICKAKGMIALLVNKQQAMTRISQKREVIGHFCGSDNVLIFVCVHVIRLCDMIMKWSYSYQAPSWSV